MLNLIIGILGMSFILIAFILNEINSKYNVNSILNNVLNIIGSSLLIYYALVLTGWPFLVLNIVWFLVASWKIGKLLKK